MHKDVFSLNMDSQKALLYFLFPKGLDGSTTASERERLINQFNDPSNTSAWVFLLSTR